MPNNKIFLNFYVAGFSEMGASKKWMKTLFGLKKANRSQYLEKDENVGGVSSLH